jgi:hypothetical protein
MSKKFTSNDIDKAFQAGIKTHSIPSPETKERLIKMETNYNNMVDKMEEIKVDNNREHKEIKEMICEVSNKIERALETKANKWVEGVMIWMGITIGTGFVGLLGWLIVEAIKRFQ